MSEKREHKREFFCLSCHPKDAPSMTPAECKKHLEEVHKMEQIPKGTKSLTMALDGDFYHNTYEWTIGDVKMAECESGPKGRRR